MYWRLITPTPKELYFAKEHLREVCEFLIKVLDVDHLMWKGPTWLGLELYMPAFPSMRKIEPGFISNIERDVLIGIAFATKRLLVYCRTKKIVYGVYKSAERIFYYYIFVPIPDDYAKYLIKSEVDEYEINHYIEEIRKKICDELAVVGNPDTASMLGLLYLLGD